MTKDIHHSTEGAEVSPELFETLIDCYADQVYRFLALRSPSPMDAEDMAQETYLLALLNLPSLEDERKAKQWLFSIANNVARQHYRRGQCRPEAPQDQPKESVATGVAMNEDALRRLAIHDTLASLSDDHQTILLLVAQVRMTIVEASWVLNIGIEALAAGLSAIPPRLRKRARPGCRRDDSTGRRAAVINSRRPAAPPGSHPTRRPSQAL